ncbi:MAG: hypothetical protein KGL51_09745 [Betaproteobacteria bacterium]|nr:hypothetical protein [Betaproteobacteria bacterium]MDE2124486.1 hypothetical protein [Betaproteobacteria bacterium]MDE2185357.1 hypothetical protein [Betaproteobacteria bacterium]MDE2324935.1 hypothetical protein [Betaproteobacteria bacterium]
MKTWRVAAVAIVGAGLWSAGSSHALASVGMVVNSKRCTLQESQEKTQTGRPVQHPQPLVWRLFADAHLWSAALRWTHRISSSKPWPAIGLPLQRPDAGNATAGRLTVEAQGDNSVAFSKIAGSPRFGWSGKSPAQGWQFRSDIDVAYPGQFDAAAAGDGDLGASGPSGLNQAAQAAYLGASSRSREYPVLQVAMAYRF